MSIDTNNTLVTQEALSSASVAHAESATLATEAVSAGSADVASQVSSTAMNKMGYMYYNVASRYSSSTVYEIIFKTKVPFANGLTISKIYVKGVSYSYIFDLELQFYIANTSFYFTRAINKGSGSPIITLFSYTDNNVEYVGFALSGISFHYCKLNVDVCDSTTYWSTYYNDWSSESNSDSTTTIIPTTNAVVAEYQGLVTNITGNATTATTATTATNALALGGYSESAYTKYGGDSAAIGYTDFDDILTQGEYSISSSTSGNAPYSYGKLKVDVSDHTTHNNSSNWIWQHFEGTNGNIYFRYKVNSSAWTAWQQILTSADGTINADKLNGVEASGFVQTGGDISSTTIGGVNLLTYIDSKIAEAIANIGNEDDGTQWESFSISGVMPGTLTFEIDWALNRYTETSYSTWYFTAREGGGWTLYGYAMGLYTTEDVEYPYQATTWYESSSLNSSIVITKIS